MLKFTKNSIVDIDLYRRRINHNGFVTVDRERMEGLRKYNVCRRDSLGYLAEKIILRETSDNVIVMNPMGIFNYLTGWAGVPEEMLSAETNSGFSVDKDHLGPILESGYATEFLSTYMEYSSLKTTTGRIGNVVNRLSETELLTKSGVKLYKLPYTASEQQNARFNYANEDLISVGKAYSTSFGVEEGYFLAWGDAAQADFRIALSLYITNEDNADLINSYEDRYEGISRAMKKTFGEEFDLDVFKMERIIYKTETLSTVYGSRRPKNRKAIEFTNRLKKFLETCPRYEEYKRRLRNYYNAEVPATVKGYFGYEQLMIPTRRADGEHAFLTKGLNTPIQTTTSEFIILVTNWILDKFYSLGYTEDDISLYMVRHDEPVFKISNKCKKDLWVLNQASKILVDDWTPMELTFDFGYYYKEADEQLTKEVQEIYASNLDKIDILEPGGHPDAIFYPVEDILTLYVGSVAIDNKTMVCVHSKEPGENGEPHTLNYYAVDSQDPKTVQGYVINLIGNAADKLYNKSQSKVVVRTNCMKDGEFNHNGVYMKFISDNCLEVLRANMVAKVLAIKYATKNNIPIDPELSPQSGIETVINQAGRLGVL